MSTAEDSASETWTGKKSLEDQDPELYELIMKEKARQVNGLELIASENFCSRAVQETLGSCLTNKYSEGLPGARFYGGNEVIDEIESMCIERALGAYTLDDTKWGVNVQPYSGSPANFAVYTALLEPHERLMGLDVDCGGHFTHGYLRPYEASASAIYFEALTYDVNKEGYIDYDKMEELATYFKPKLIIAGTSMYARQLDYPRFRKVCDKVGALMLADMSHISGLIATGVHPSPFPYADIVTSTTHKTLRGPRSGLIFYRKGVKEIVGGKPVLYDYEDRINLAIFPGLQGGPHDNTFAAVGVALRESRSPMFKSYCNDVLANAKVLAKEFIDRGYEVITGGTDVHLVIVDVRPKGVDGWHAEYVLEDTGISVSKATVPIKPGYPNLTNQGLRIGSAPLSSRQMKPRDFVQVCQFLDKGIRLSNTIREKFIKDNGHEPTFDEYKEFVETDSVAKRKVERMKKKVTEFAVQYPMPGRNDR